MKTGMPLRTLGALLLSLAWCGAVLAFRHYRPLRVPAERAKIATLRAELDSLPADAAAQLRSWRDSQPRGTDGTRAVLDSLASEGWRVTDADDGIRLEIADPAAARWPGIIRAVERIESAGGAGVRSLRIETAGSRTVRRFSRIEIGLRAEDGSSPANPVRTPPEPGVGPGSGPGAAGLRETGPGTLSAVRPTPPAATPGAGSVFRTGVAPVPATLAPAAGSVSSTPTPE